MKEAFKKIRPITFGIFVWFIMVVLISIIAIVFKISDAGVWPILPLVVFYIGVVALVSLTAHWYYKSQDAKINGFLLGLTWVIVDIILESLITIPMFILPTGQTHLEYFLRWDMLVNFALIIIPVGVYDIAKRHSN